MVERKNVAQYKLKNMGVSPVGINNAYFGVDGIENCRVKSMLDYREISGRLAPFVSI